MTSSLRRIVALIVKELLAVLREPRSRYVVIVPPLVQFLVFGYAATFDVTDVRYAVLDRSRSEASRALLARLEGSESFRLVRTLESTDQIDDVIDPQVARLVVHVGPDFEDRLASGEPAVVGVIADGRNSNVASVAVSYVARVAAAYAAERSGTLPSPPGRGTEPTIELVDRAWFNANLESRWYVVTPLAATIAMVVVMLLTSLSVAREREFGTFDQLLVAPFRPTEILVGKAVPGMAFGVLDGLFLSALAVVWFDVPFRGSVVALLLVLALFVLAIVGLGLLVSSVSTTMQQGLLGAFVFIMPAVILSGFTSPIENMPAWLRACTLANPLRYAVSALRRIFLEGAGTPEIAGELLPLLAIAAATLPAAGWMFRHRSG